MKLSIPEQLARLIKAKLLTIAAGNDYDVTVVDVVRPARRSTHTPYAGLVVLTTAPDLSQDEDLNDAAGVRKQRSVTFFADYFIDPRDDDPTPLDALQFQAIAEIERALASGLEASDALSLDGIGTHGRLEAPQLTEAADGGSAGVRVSITIDYVHTDLDPYTPAPH